MKNSKYIYCGIILACFLIFCVYLSISSRSYQVIEIRGINEIGIDFDNDGIIKEDEYTALFNDYGDITSCENFVKFGILKDEIPLIEYLTNKFVKDKLLDKKVCIKSNNLYYDNINFNQLLIDSGFLFKNGNPVNIDSLDKLLSDIRKSDYKILNLRSKKYHNLSCKYGKLSRDYIFIPRSQLPRDAGCCKFCAETGSKYIDKSKNVQLIYSDDDIKIYLTDHTTKLLPDRYCNSNICKELIKNIDNAKHSIDIAIYGYDRVPAVEKALNRAITRGVKIRLVRDVDFNNSNIYADTDYFSKFIKFYNADYPSNVSTNPSGYANSIMHNKFYIFDDKVVMTGSANLSSTDMSGFNSNSVIVINSNVIAQIYKEEFNQMYFGKFHNLKKAILNKTNINLNKSNISIYFSPIDKIISNVILPIINNARVYIYIPTFLITDKRVSSALINAKNRGVDIKIVVDATNAKNSYSVHKILRENGVKVKVENYAGKMHSKSMIVDDKYVVIGSMNLSKSGELKNDENLVVVNSPSAAKFYKSFFMYLWARIPDFWLSHDPGAESKYSIGSCSDGIDNDYDGLIDSADEGCRLK